MNERLDAIDDMQPNIVERRITPALLRQYIENGWHKSEDLSIWDWRSLCELGGPDIERFLLRQDWRARVAKDSSNRQRDGLLLNVHTRTMDYARGSPVASSKEIWVNRWIYLLEMEPISTEKMYVEAWRASRYSQNIFQQALDLLKDLPAEKHRSVVEAVIREVERDVSNISDSSGKFGQGQDETRKAMLDILRTYLEDDFLEGEAKRKLAEIRGKPQLPGAPLQPPQIRHSAMVNAAGFLRSHPNHPLMVLAAESEEPWLRSWASSILRTHPTARNRRILEKLLNDPDENVRNNAKYAMDELAKLAAASPLDYAAPVSHRIQKSKKKETVDRK